MKDYVNKLAKEADFLVNTVLTDEEVYTPGDKEYSNYIAGVKTIDKMVYKHEGLEIKKELEDAKEKNRHEEANWEDVREVEKEKHRHEEEMEKIQIDGKDRSRRTDIDARKIEYDRVLEEEKEKNRHREELVRIGADIFVNTSKTVGELAGGVIKGIVIIGAVKIISESEETKVLSKMAMDVVTKFVKIF